MNDEEQMRFLAQHQLSVFRFDKIDSTNNEAKRACRAGACRRGIFIAREQTAGRGRQGKNFSSPAGAGVYFSLLYPVAGSLETGVTITSAAAVAVRRAVEKITGIKLGIKWVNDLYYNGKKVCGILTEATAGDETDVVIGIGINLKSEALPPELVKIARGLDVALDPDRLIFSICRELIAALEDPADRSWLADYRNSSIVLGKRVNRTENGESRSGTAVSIGDRGELELLFDDGTREILRTGEISITF